MPERRALHLDADVDHAGTKRRDGGEGRLGQVEAPPGPLRGPPVGDGRLHVDAGGAGDAHAGAAGQLPAGKRQLLRIEDTAAGGRASREAGAVPRRRPGQHPTPRRRRLLDGPRPRRRGPGRRWRMLAGLALGRRLGHRGGHRPRLGDRGGRERRRRVLDGSGCRRRVGRFPDPQREEPAGRRRRAGSRELTGHRRGVAELYDLHAQPRVRQPVPGDGQLQAGQVRQPGLGQARGDAHRRERWWLRAGRRIDRRGLGWRARREHAQAQCERARSARVRARAASVHAHTVGRAAPVLRTLVGTVPAWQTGGHTVFSTVDGGCITNPMSGGTDNPVPRARGRVAKPHRARARPQPTADRTRRGVAE